MRVSSMMALKPIATFYGLSPALLRRSCRIAGVVRARDAYIWWCRTHNGTSYPKLGQLLNKHHTTIIAAYKRSCRRIAEDTEFADEIVFIETLLASGNGCTPAPAKAIVH